MRASTVFILALALLIGLAVAAAAKSAGLFNPKPPAAAAAPPPAARVLAARVNLYEDIAVTSEQVYVRELRPQEEQRLKDRFGDNWRDKVLPALASAAHLRTALKNIPADTILLREHLAESALPDSLTKQLELNTRPVNVAVSKANAAGGVVRVGEYVDVFLTSNVGVGGREDMRIGCIARGCKVIMKRNIIWPVIRPDSDTAPLNFTLQANLYRAALINYARAFGELSLMPVAAPIKTSNSFSDPSSPEYANEDQRVDEVARGVRTIGTEDLARIFRVVPPTAPPAGPPPLQPIRIPHIVHTQYGGQTVLPGIPPTETPPVTTPIKPLDPNNGAAAPRTTEPGAGDVARGGDLTFRLPSATGDTGSGCKNCDAKRKAAEAARYKTIRP